MFDTCSYVVMKAPLLDAGSYTYQSNEIQQFRSEVVTLTSTQMTKTQANYQLFVAYFTWIPLCTYLHVYVYIYI